ncbi:MAG: hypothetical protein WC806_03350 [Candidatus Gracilibacteria bacterium]|jgi:hypothetical protein
MKGYFEKFKVFLKNFKAEMSVAVSACKGNVIAFSHIYGKKEAFVWAFWFLFLPPIVNLLLTGFAFPSDFFKIFYSRYLFWPIFVPVIALILSILAVAYFLEKVLHKHIDKKAFLAVFGYVSLSLWITMISFVLMVLGFVDDYKVFELTFFAGALYMVYIMYVFLKEHFKLNKEEIVFCILVGIIADAFTGSLLGRICIGSFYTWF